MSRTKLFSFVIALVLSFGFVVPAIAQTTGVAQTTDCFEHYNFGSIEVLIDSTRLDFKAGETVSFSGYIQNNNPYPIVDGKVYVKVFDTKVASGDEGFGMPIVDQFFALDNINIPAQGRVPTTINWKIPLNLVSGDYKLATFFVSAEAFNLLGLSFTNDVIGNSVDFHVQSKTLANVTFDNKSVLINKELVYFATPAPRVTGTATITAPIINSSKENKTVLVEWEVYSWDALKEENLIRKESQQVSLKPGEKKSLEFKVAEEKVPVYYIIGTLQDKDSKSILDIRFARPKIDKARLNFLGVSSYPLEKGKENTLFACFHDMTQDSSPDGKVVMSVKDMNGKVLNSATYTGAITGDVMGIKNDFVPRNSLKSFVLEASLYQKGVLQDTAKLTYECSLLNPGEACKENALSPLVVIVSVIGGLVVLIILFVLFKITRNKVPAVMVALILAGGAFVGIQRVDASEVQTTKTFTGYFWAQPRLTEGTGWQKRIGNLTTTLKYRAHVKNLTTNSYVVDGSKVTVGDQLLFHFGAHAWSDIYWNGTGYISDTPYGQWIANAGRPTTASMCGVSKYFWEQKDDAFKSYVALSVTPPVKVLSTNLNGTAQLDNCVSVGTNGDKQCRVASPGTITTRFTFNSTKGRFYNLYQHLNRPQDPCDGGGDISIYSGPRLMARSKTSDVSTIVDGYEMLTFAEKSLTFTYSAEASQCTYTIGEWGECVAGSQTRTVTATPSGCTGSAPATTQTCQISCSEGDTQGSCSTKQTCTAGGVWVSTPENCGGGSTCTLSGITVSDGQSYTFYKDCDGLSRVCSNRTFSGDDTYTQTQPLSTCAGSVLGEITCKPALSRVPYGSKVRWSALPSIADAVYEWTDQVTGQTFSGNPVIVGPYPKGRVGTQSIQLNVSKGTANSSATCSVQIIDPNALEI